MYLVACGFDDGTERKSAAGLQGLQQLEPVCGQHLRAGRKLIKTVDGPQALTVQGVMDVAGQIPADGLCGERQAWSSIR